MKKNIGKRIKSIGFVLMLTISVLLSFSVTVSADPVDNDVYALIVPQGYVSWDDINTTGHVEMGDTFNVTFNITINEQINSIGLDNVTFTQSIVNGTGTVVQGDALVGGSTVVWITTDWSTNADGYASPLATWAKTEGTNNSVGVICNTTWNALSVGVGYINFTDACGTSYGATDKGTVFHNGTVYVHPAHPVSPSAVAYSDTQINHTWTKGAGADRTVIVAKINSLPTDINDGSIIYNNTGTSYEHSGLNGAEHWYYRYYSFHVSEGLFSVYNLTDDATTLDSNQPPTFSGPSITNGSSGVDIPSSWSITINDPEGDNFDWTIQTSPNVGSASQNGQTNGSKSVTLTGVQYSTLYTVYVNATDAGSSDWTREWFTFATRSENVPGVPGSFTATADGRFEIDLSWTKGSNTDYTYIEWRAISGTWNRGDETELYNNTGTSTSQSGLNPGTTRYYQAWSYNTTDGTWSSSYAAGHDTTDSNTAPSFGSESPSNGTGGQELSFSWSVPINDADGDTFNWTIECNNSQMSNADGSSNGTKSLPLSGLAYATTYTVWVNATDSYDSTSEWFTFATRSENVPDAPGSFDAATFSSSFIALTWTKGANADCTYIRYKIDSYPTDRTDGIFLYNDTGTDASAINLDAHTNYYFRAWSYNLTDNAWSTSYSEDNDTTLNNVVDFGTPSPANATGNQELSFSWQISITDDDADTFNWTIECNNSQSSNANGESNGTKSLVLSGLAYTTTYTVWVNATDSYDWTRAWFTFTTKDEPVNEYPTFGTPNPTNGSTGVSHSLSSWTIPVNDPEGDSFNWTMETSPNVGSASQTGEGNGTKSCTISGLSYSTTYTIFVNATDTGSGNWNNQTFWFSTESSPNQNPNPPADPDPENNEPDVPVNVGEFSCLVTDPDGDSLDCSAYWSNHTLIDTNNSVANNTIVRFDVGTLEKDTTYYWYVNVSDGEFTVQSAVWNFTTVDNYAPVADFTLDVDNATQMIWVNDTSTDSDGTVVYWSWDFDDGTSEVHTQDAIHSYSTGGNYTVELTIIDNDGGSDSKTLDVTLNYPPTASFLYTASDMNITVNGTSTDTEGAIVNWTWDWDDGNFSYTQNATHQYTVADTYLVNLTVQDSHGSTTSTWNALTFPPSATAGFIENVDWLVIGAIIACILAGVFFVAMVWKG